MEVAGSCLAVAGATVTVVFKITKLIVECQGLRPSLELVRTELESMESILFLIADNVHKVISDGAMVSKSLVNRLDTVNKACQVAIQDTSNIMDKYAAGGIRQNIEWVVKGKEELTKTKQHLHSRRMDLDVCLNMLNISLASGIRIGTTQILDGQAIIHDDVQRIMTAISSLQADQSKMEELLELLRSMATHRTDNFLMDRFIDSLTSYAETVHDRSVFGQDEFLPVLPPLQDTGPLMLATSDTTKTTTVSSGPSTRPSRTFDRDSRCDHSVADGSDRPMSTVTTTLTIPNSETANSSQPSQTRTLPLEEHNLANHSPKEKGSESCNDMNQALPTATSSHHEALQKFEIAKLDAMLRAIGRKTNPASVHNLIQAGADPNRKDFDVETRAFLTQPENNDYGLSDRLPLASAVLAGNEGCVKALIERGADPKEACPQTWPPIYYAIRNESICTMQLLAKAGLDLNRPFLSSEAYVPATSQNRLSSLIFHSPLLAAIQQAPLKSLQSSFALVRALLEAGADPKRCHRDEHNATAWIPLPPLSQCIGVEPLIAATDMVHGKHLPDISHTLSSNAKRTMSHIGLMLMRRGADPNACGQGNKPENHPLVLALIYRNPLMLEVLIMNGSKLPVLGSQIKRFQNLSRMPSGQVDKEPEDRQSENVDSRKAQTFTDAVFATILADGRRSGQSWLASLIKQQPLLGTWCLLDAVSSILSITQSGVRGQGLSSKDGKFIIELLLLSGASTQAPDRVIYDARRLFRKTIPKRKEGQMSPMKLIEEVWLRSEDAGLRSELRNLLLQKGQSIVYDQPVSMRTEPQVISKSQVKLVKDNHK